ncbi:hypothetical protein Fmac_010705 [Flemingia macrophylla]|uniref:Uncharacterized protein n=1 Tax=Flemingia macrophylla TaxID=520843 RepID=A0ABD1MKG7_9FABA
MAKFSFIHYFTLFLIISVVSMESEVNGKSICTKVVQPDWCDFEKCELRCKQSFGIKLVSSQCTQNDIGSTIFQCRCFYHC